MTFHFSQSDISNFQFRYELSWRVWNRFDEDIEVVYVGSDEPLALESIKDAWGKSFPNGVKDRFEVLTLA